MARKSTTATATLEENGDATAAPARKAKATERKTLKGVRRKHVTVRVLGIAPLITHNWDEKAKKMMRDKKVHGKKTKSRDMCDPEEEGKAAQYLTKDGKPGVLATAFKNSLIESAHNDLGIARTLVRKSLFILPYGRNVILPIESADGKKEVKWSIEEDMVRVGAGAADLRWRPYYFDWACTLKWEIDADLLQLEDLLTLIDRAGFGVGVCEWRPGCGGEYGRYRIDPKFDVIVEDV